MIFYGNDAYINLCVKYAAEKEKMIRLWMERVVYISIVIADVLLIVMIDVTTPTSFRFFKKSKSLNRRKIKYISAF